VDLTGHVALLTGSSGGLGRSIALELAKAGCDVALHYFRHREAAETLREEVTALGRRAVAVGADVRDPEQVEAMVRTALESLGRIHFLINGAGVSRDAMVWKMKASDWDDVLRTNLSGAFNCTRAVLPVMREQGGGRIVSLASVVGQAGIAGTSAYAASKAGLMGFTRAVAREAAPKNVTVNALALGYFSAGVIHTLSTEMQQAVLRQIPFGRFGDPRHVGQLIVFLCSEAGSYITGQTININGGVYM
jgi:3-oxoacyl-[acyl-carrier protein] reductase